MKGPRPGHSAGRVVAGTARGIRLVAAGEGTRPLGDRLKQALFAILEPELRDGRFLDLFAGSGAAGIEALSRGAATATFVEQDRAAIATIRANLERAHLLEAAQVVRAEAIEWLASPRARDTGPFDVVVVDPPYARPELLRDAISILGAGRVLARPAVVVAKHATGEQPPERAGLLRSDRERRFGDSTLTFYRAAGPSTEEP